MIWALNLKAHPANALPFFFFFPSKFRIIECGANTLVFASWGSGSGEREDSEGEVEVQDGSRTLYKNEIIKIKIQLLLYAQIAFGETLINILLGVETCRDGRRQAIRHFGEMKNFGNQPVSGSRKAFPSIYVLRAARPPCK